MSERRDQVGAARLLLASVRGDRAGAEAVAREVDRRKYRSALVALADLAAALMAMSVGTQTTEQRFEQALEALQETGESK